MRLLAHGLVARSADRRAEWRASRFLARRRRQATESSRRCSVRLHADTIELSTRQHHPAQEHRVAAATSVAGVRRSPATRAAHRVGGPLTPRPTAPAVSSGSRMPSSSCRFRRGRSWPPVPARRLLLLPSPSEGFGLPVVEAMAAGAVVVASDLPVLRESAATPRCIAPGDADEWVDSDLCSRRARPFAGTVRGPPTPGLEQPRTFRGTRYASG